MQNKKSVDTFLKINKVTKITSLTFYKFMNLFFKLMLCRFNVYVLLKRALSHQLVKKHGK